ncbi:unnamed protein product [Vitrella brassicaformis CCMP3155]|uniref:Uncharacterized protein n=1 Tax=Vitrella brassicaformis (strain CCMP3155) TaxID=1169540 RepID=A0A0G4GWG3_VITBC|nr:unnamed protein product [Vitrella brassicaformis CCMP3155]|eukprot:CEM35348.1 unnamed protein product [Vitrella brassicaformis CCMP3155]
MAAAAEAAFSPEKTDGEGLYVSREELQKQNADLKFKLQRAQEEKAQLGGRIAYLENLPPRVEVMEVQKPSYRTFTYENADRMRALRNTIQSQQDELVELRAKLVAERGAKPPPEIIEKEVYIEVPKVETKVIDMSQESAAKLAEYVDQVKNLQQQLAAKESELAGLQAARSVEVREVEVESGPRIRMLMQQMREKEEQIAELAQECHRLRNLPPTIEKIIRERVIEVPQVETVRVRVSNDINVERIRQFVLSELRRLEEYIRRLESCGATVIELNRTAEGLRTVARDLLDLIEEGRHAEGPLKQISTVTLPRRTLQAYTPDPNDKVDVRLSELLMECPCAVPFYRIAHKQYEFGSLVVHVDFAPDGVDLQVKLIDYPNVQPMGFRVFLSTYERQEFQKLKFITQGEVQLQHLPVSRTIYESHTSATAPQVQMQVIQGAGASGSSVSYHGGTVLPPGRGGVSTQQRVVDSKVVYQQPATVRQPQYTVSSYSGGVYGSSIAQPHTVTTTHTTGTPAEGRDAGRIGLLAQALQGRDMLGTIAEGSGGGTESDDIYLPSQPHPYTSPQ